MQEINTYPYKKLECARAATKLSKLTFGICIQKYEFSSTE